LGSESSFELPDQLSFHKYRWPISQQERTGSEAFETLVKSHEAKICGFRKGREIGVRPGGMSGLPPAGVRAPFGLEIFGLGKKIKARIAGYA
jgi:hypothetical protein